MFDLRAVSFLWIMHLTEHLYTGIFFSSCRTLSEARLRNSKHPRTKPLSGISEGFIIPLPEGSFYSCCGDGRKVETGLFWERIARRIAVSAGVVFQVFLMQNTFFTVSSTGARLKTQRMANIMPLVYWIIFTTSRWTQIQLIPAESRFGDEPFFLFCTVAFV